jgi:hypothetical protein
MFANTLTVTISGVAKVLTRVNQDNYGSTYLLKDGTQEFRLQFRNSSENGNPEQIDRHNAFFEWTVYATSTATEKYYSCTSTFRLRKSSDPAILGAMATGFATLVTAQQSGLIGGES